MSGPGSSVVQRASSRLEATESMRVLDDATRARRQQKALENLEQDNFHLDPHAQLQWDKKRPKFEDGEVTVSGGGVVKKRKTEDKMDSASIKKRKMMRGDHFKQRFRKNFMQLLHEESALRKEGDWEYQAYANAAAPPPDRPPRKLCSVCGFFSKYNCVRCGSRFCCIRCRDVHSETRCLKWTA